MQYTIPEINNNVAKIEFSDGTYSFIELKADMTEAELDEIAYMIAPPHLKTGSGTPSFLTAGSTRTGTAITDIEPDPLPTWLQNRIDAYGTTQSQLEYITENGLEAWQAHVAQIKTDNPKE